MPWSARLCRFSAKAHDTSTARHAPTRSVPAALRRCNTSITEGSKCNHTSRSTASASAGCTDDAVAWPSSASSCSWRSADTTRQRGSQAQEARSEPPLPRRGTSQPRGRCGPSAPVPCPFATAHSRATSLRFATSRQELPWRNCIAGVRRRSGAPASPRNGRGAQPHRCFLARDAQELRYAGTWASAQSALQETGRRLAAAPRVSRARRWTPARSGVARVPAAQCSVGRSSSESA